MTTAAAKSGGDSGPAVGWIGSLAHTPLAEVFRRIVLEERGGDLQVTSPSAIKTVYFDRGFVVFASSDLKSDRLGESMIEAGRLSGRDFDLASTLTEGGKRKFGQALVQAGIVSEEEVGRHVAAQVNGIVLSLFSEKQGMYSFDERPCIIPVELMVSLSVYRILIEGIRRMSSGNLILAGLPPLGTRLRMVAEPPFTLDLEKLRPVEKAVLRSVGKGMSLREIARTVDAKEGVVLRACYGLCAAGLVEAVTDDSLSRPLRVQEETGTFVLSEIRRKVEEAQEVAKSAPATAADRDRPLQTPPAAQPEVRDRAPLSRAEAVTPSERDAERGHGPWAERITSVAARMGVLRSSLSEACDRARARWEELLAGARRDWSLSRLVSSALRSIKLWVLDPIRSRARRLQRRVVQLTQVLDSRERAGRQSPKTPPRVGRPGSSRQSRPTADRESGEPSELGRALSENGRNEARGEVQAMVSLGVPAWSIKDDSSDASNSPTTYEEVGTEHRDQNPVAESVGVPSWSMIDDPGGALKRVSDAHEQVRSEGREQGPVVESVGVPSWSVIDDPSDAVRRFSEPSEQAGWEPREQNPVVESVGVPRWSMKDDPGAPEEQSTDSYEELGLKPREQRPEIELKKEELSSPSLPPATGDRPPVVTATEKPLASLDGDLSGEPELEEDDQSSMLTQLPAEEIELEGKGPEFDIEFEEETLAELSKRAEAAGGKEEHPDAREMIPPATFSAPTPVSSPEGKPHPERKAAPARGVDGEGEAAASSSEQKVRAPRVKPQAEEARLLRDVKLHFKFQDWDGVVPLLEQLLAISPRRALYRGMLARAMSRNPRLRKDAEKHFVEALRLSPQDPEIHYWLGLYYQSFGLKSRAHHEFQTTLRIDPNHKGARTELAGGKKDDGGVIKKFFG